MAKILAAAVAILVLIQLIPLDRDNPPVIQDVAAPSEVDAILRRACYDCHSNETEWPWYSHVAPVSFLVVHDVHEGREHLNFSDWEHSRKDVDEILEEVEEGEMPMKIYLITHPNAALSDADLATIRSWVKSEQAN